MTLKAMRFGSVCSGIEAASVAFEPLGWDAAWVSEIEPFPSAVLAHRYPDVPNLGDMTSISPRVLTGQVEAPDLLCGGTPCQAFSVAGLRRSLADDRGNLTLSFVEIADAIDYVRGCDGRPLVIVKWENVPGVLSTADNAFGCFLAGLSGEDEPLQPPGGRWANAGAVYGPKRAFAWRTLDAQYFGLAQRRRRVFVVASARAGFDPAAVLFEWDGVRRDTAPRREARQVAPTIPSRSTGGGGLGTDFDIDGGVICMAHGQGGAEVASERSPTLTCNHEAPIAAIQCVTGDVAHTLKTEAFDASEDGAGRGQPIVPVYAIQAGALRQNPNSGPDGVGVQEGVAYTMESRAEVQAIAFPARMSGTQCAHTENVSPAPGALNPTAVAVQASQSGVRINDIAGTLDANYGSRRHNGVMSAAQVRRLTPTECERLQGFPDGHTLIPWRGKPADECPDGPRYKALGNSWAVPVVRWIGARIQLQISRNKE